MKEGTVRRTARRGPFLTEARARERTATYKNGYSNITEPKKNDRVGLSRHPESVAVCFIELLHGPPFAICIAEGYGLAGSLLYSVPVGAL